MGVLDGKVAIVTGAGRGLGRAHAEALAQAGAAIVVNDPGVSVHGEEGSEARGPADEVVEAIKTAGGQATANYASVSDWAGAEGLIQTAVEAFGKLDILVNNAGIVRDRMSYNMAEAEWDPVVDVHLKGHFAPSRFAATYWRSRAKSGDPVSGRIINTSSEAGLFGNMGQANYGAAKAGILGLTMVQARELERLGVTVNAISPRASTRFTGDVAVDPNNPVEQGRAEDVAPLVVYLASDAAAHINGQVFLNFGGHLKLLKGWHTAAELHKDSAFTMDDIGAAVEKLFEGNSSTLDPFLP